MPSSTHVDHILLGIADLDRGVRELESRTGVHAVYGGEHPHMGTHNALISLGPATYLEVIAPRPGASLTPDLDILTKLEHLTPIGWAASATDITALRKQLEQNGFKTTKPQPGSRKKPTGEVLQWQTFSIESEIDNAPFFIHWDDPAMHPAKNSPGGCTLEHMEFDDPHAEELRRFQRAVGLDFTVHSSANAAMRITLHCGTRTVLFPNANP